jgi:hypothetical protein
MTHAGDKTVANEWYVKYKLIEAVPLFIKRGETDVLVVVASCIDHGRC